MIYEPCEQLTRSKVVTEMPFPRIATLLSMKLSDIIVGLEQMIAGAPGKNIHDIILILNMRTTVL